MKNSQRLISLDAFRGFTIAAMILVNFPASWKNTYYPLQHAEWNGITPTDFIFPFFIFIIGVSIALSYTKMINAGSPKSLMIRKIITRSIKIFVIGILLRLLPNFDIGNIELPGVLQRISFVFLISSILFLISDWKIQAIIGTVILIFYWISMQYLPVPGIGTGILEPGKNMAAWIDRIVIPKNLLNSRGYDSDGFFSSFPAVSTCIAGILTGRFMLTDLSKERKVIWLFVGGILFIVLGQIWDWGFPINKKLWTSSYVLYTAGWASVIFAILILFIDILGYKKWCRTGIIFGSNAIAVYVLADVFETIFIHTSLKPFIYNSLLSINFHPKAASLIWALFSVSVCYLAALLLYRKKIFIKL